MTGICNLSIIPLRQQPSEKSEMVTQLLFGEYYTVLDRINGWILVQTVLDHYEGWMDEKVLCVADDSFAKDNSEKPVHILNETVAKAVCLNDKEIIYLVRGSTLPMYEKGRFRLNDQFYETEGMIHCLSAEPEPGLIIPVASKYLNSPYLWGGRSPFGIDCSGFVQAVYRYCGIQIPRDASQQAQLGEGIDFIDAMQPGDLAFFENSSGNISHVGILITQQQIIHASGSVRIDTIDHHGIFNHKLGKYTHTLRLIKRII